MNLWLIFGVFVVLTIVGALMAGFARYDQDILEGAGMSLAATNAIFAIFMCVIAIVCSVSDKDLDFRKQQVEIQRQQYIEYANSEEMSPALMQMYFDDIQAFNREVYHCKKYGDKWMLRHIRWDPAYEDSDYIYGFEPDSVQEE